MKLIEDYRSYLSTLKVVSRDKNSQVSLIEDETKEHRLVNFDGVKKKLCKDFRGDALSSCDGYLNKGGVRYLIEFKNQAEGNIDKTIIKNKAYDSLSLLAMNENLTREELAGDTVLVIVFNNEKYVESNHSYQSSDSLDKLTMKLKRLSKKDELDQYPKKFDTRRYINQFYKNVYTIDIKVFKKKFMDILFSSTNIK